MQHELIKIHFKPFKKKKKKSHSLVVKSRGSALRQILPLFLDSSVTLGKLLNVSVLSSPCISHPGLPLTE